MIAFTIRNLKLFFRDRSAVFFSLLSVFIIISLYVLFLGKAWSGNLTGMPGVRFLMDSWIMSGLLAVTSVTTTMGAYGTMVDDKASKVIKDFASSPIKKWSLAGGYIISSYIIGVIMTLATLILAEVYIIAYGGSLLSFPALLQVLGLILLSSLTNTSLILFIVSFFKSNKAFATASTIIGTLIGFLAGIYLPVGALSDKIQWVVRIFPVSHSAALLRNAMMAQPLSITFSGVPQKALEDYKTYMGVTIKAGDQTISPIISIVILVVTAIIFYGLASINLSRKKT